MSFRVVIPLDFELISTGIIHGLAFWFEIGFLGTRYVISMVSMSLIVSLYPLFVYSAAVWLSTAPHQPLTHWYQVCYNHRYIILSVNTD